jgi:uncharacterized BrkB/YihY/UPF0761 family membrane protein
MRTWVAIVIMLLFWPLVGAGVGWLVGYFGGNQATAGAAAGAVVMAVFLHHNWNRAEEDT